MILQAGSKVGQPVRSEGTWRGWTVSYNIRRWSQFGSAKLLKHSEDLEWDIGKMLVFQTILTG